MSGMALARKTRLAGLKASLAAFTDAFRASFSPRTQAEANFVARQLAIGTPSAQSPWYLLPLA